jgi:hypothetical protein
VTTFVTRTVATVMSERPGFQRLALDDASRAYALTAIVGPVAAGDRVVVNTTAVDLRLGTGGWHVVHWNLSRHEWSAPSGGHAMKLRYTGAQIDTDVAEAHTPNGPSTVIDGVPVVLCGLHSQMAVVTVVVKAAAPSWRVVYVMTDGGALPAALSDLVAELRERGLLDATVTAGHAFGGDLEAVNVASALTVARHDAGADVVVVAMGPGGVGTGSALGYTALEVAPALDAAASLGGRPVACLRYSEADPRPRHQGVSHHSLTALRLASRRALVPLPEGPFEARARRQLRAAGLDERHDVCTVATPDVAGLLQDLGLVVETMGRSPADDPGFFALAGAAGAAAVGRADVPGTVQR